MKTLYRFAFILILISCPSIGHAAAAACEAVTYYDKLNQKFDAGTRNFLTGWTQILTEPADQYQKNKYWGPLAGIGLGTLNAVADTCGGFLNMATAPAPQFQIPLPKGGVSQKRLISSEINRCDTKGWAPAAEKGVDVKERAPASPALGY